MEDYTIHDLEDCFREAKIRSMPFIGVKIQMNGFKKTEIIINPSENFDKKLEYYKKAYNEDLTLKAVNTIKIINFAWGTNYAEIQSKLL